MQSHVQGIADDGMPDAYLVGPWYHLMIVVEVDKTEIVSGIKSKSLSACLLGSLDKWGNGSLAVTEVVGCIGLGT